MGRKLAPTVALVALLAAGCGQAVSTESASSSQQPAAAQQAAPAQPAAAAQQGAPVLHAHPQAVEPVAGAVAQASQPANPPSSFSVGSGSSAGSVAQPVSDAQVRQELAASG